MWTKLLLTQIFFVLKICCTLFFTQISFGHTNFLLPKIFGLNFFCISWDSVHICQNCFLRWNHEIEPLDLNTVNPIIWTIFFRLLRGQNQTSEEIRRVLESSDLAEFFFELIISWENDLFLITFDISTFLNNPKVLVFLSLINVTYFY